MGKFATEGGLAGKRLPKACSTAVLLLLLQLTDGVAVASAIPIRISAGHIQIEGYSLVGVAARLDDSGAILTIEKIGIADEQAISVNEFSLLCPRPEVNAGDPCAGGAWSLTLANELDGWRVPLSGIVDRLAKDGGTWSLLSSLSNGDLTAKLDVSRSDERIEATVNWHGQQVKALPAIPLLPEQWQWISKGSSTGTMRVLALPSAATVVRYELELGGLGFDSPDGRFAAEDLAVQCTGFVTLGDAIEAGINAEIGGGAVLLDNFYTSFDDSSMRLRSQLQLVGNRLNINELEVSDGNSLLLQTRASLNLDQPDAPLDYRVDRLEMQFPLAYERYIESTVAAATLDGLTVTGSLAWKGAGPGRVAGAGALDLVDLSIVDSKRGRFAVTGLDAHVAANEQEPRREGGGGKKPDNQALESHVSWRGLLLQRINLGAGTAALSARPGHYFLAEPLRLEVLGGQLALDELQVHLPNSNAAVGAEPDIQLFASLHDLDMEQLTQALGWPAFSGKVSGEIPGVTVREGVLAVEGEIKFEVFSGRVLLSGLRIERPFGVLPSLAADLEVRDLDLQQLTQTFSFGQISGQMSGYVHDLRMLDWEPVAFDAWFGTPVTEKGSHEISRQAVNHLTTIGGGSATTALAGPVMKLFNNFSYKRLGLGCRLSNNTCEVRGLDDDQASVLIMEGAGVPKIMIRAYNRQMDWPSLVNGLTAASQGESIRVGDKP